MWLEIIMVRNCIMKISNEKKKSNFKNILKKNVKCSIKKIHPDDE